MFCSLLTVAFIVLKLCDVINWSWWLVLSPMILVATLIIVLTIFQIIEEIR